ncbi:uncharacterized protein LOC126834175 isoform X3 [Adelges cooleyi]|uniref:uncharacterized protein LOC126834175 isoform X3 n=1 Tax=Adelges cooleyi TaxID=133065 RepID=UPI00217F69EB|nr:uncharacterized protein LOC126834175 isoform X3 [Adelges cooleyi]
MIAKICTFLLCCFAIMSNIKTTESAGNSQINPIRFFVQRTHVNYSRMLNNVKTFRDHPIVIKSKDQKILSKDYKNIKEYRLKLKSRDKLEKKAKDVKCSFCVIVKSNILCLKNLVELLKSGKPFIYNKKLHCLYNYKTIENTILHLKWEAELIVKLLLADNLETAQWLWSYFLKIIATRQYNQNKPFIRENPFDDDQLQTGVSDFIGNCIAEKHLPPTAMESDFVSKNISIYINMFTGIRKSVYFVDYVLDRNYDNMIELFYLKPFWNDQRQLLFGQIAQVNVDWSKAKQRHEVEVVITREFVKNRTWIYKPYGRFDHQMLLIKIIDARFYCYFSVMLHVYEKQLFILEEETVKDIKNLICYFINEALILTAFKDEFLVMILSELDLAKISDTDYVKDISARVRTKANVILNDLNAPYTNENDLLRFNGVENQLLTNDLIMRIITNFIVYLNELKSICLPSVYETFLHFMGVVVKSSTV